MGKEHRNKGSKQGSRKVPARSADGGATGGSAAYSVSSGGGLEGFFKSRFLLTFALLFIVLMVAAFWFLYRPQPVTVALAVVVLALALRAVFWLVSRVQKNSDEVEEDDQPLNDKHDRRDYLSSQREEFESLITQAPLLQADLNSETPSAKIKELEKRLKDIEQRVLRVEFKLDKPEQGQPIFRDRSPKTGTSGGGYSSEAASYSPPQRQPSVYNRSESYERVPSAPKSVDLQTLNEAICRFLAQESGSWEIEQLVQSVQRSSDGNAPIEIQHLGSYSSGEWRLVALWPQRSQEGLALVSSGELVDDDIAKYFEVSFGRRIIACKQPARVSRSGSEVTVLQRGRVESS